MLIPLIFTAILAAAAAKRVNIVEAFTKGAAEGLKTALDILPMLILLMTAVSMLSASGAVGMLAGRLSGVLELFGFPPECIRLALIRPVSGSGALAVLEDILAALGPDSYAGRVASVLMASTETTFYTVTVYFAALGKRADKRIFAAAALADLTGFLLAPITVRLFIK